jgi:hypothetical protein
MLKPSVQLATLPAGGPTGGFFHLGEPLPWQTAVKWPNSRIEKRKIELDDIPTGLYLKTIE